MAAKESMGLREMLMGKPLWSAEDDASVACALDSHLLGVLELLPKVYGTDEPCRQAALELGAVVDMDGTRRECLACKRAALLFAMHAEAEVAGHWRGRRSDGSAALARDLSARVLPFVVPRFLRHSCQAPEAFVTLVLVLAEMWEGEQLGNWPLTNGEAAGAP